MELLADFLFYGKFIAIIFAVWLVLLYLTNHRGVRGFLTTVFSIFIYQTIAYINLGYLDKFIMIAVFVQAGVCAISVFVFEVIRDFLLKRNQKK